MTSADIQKISEEAIKIGIAAAKKTDSGSVNVIHMTGVVGAVAAAIVTATLVDTAASRTVREALVGE